MEINDYQLVSDQDDETGLVEAMADVMATKLYENRGKLHWLSSGMTLDGLFTKLDDEINELRATALTAGGPDVIQVWFEAADVANFAAMIADRCTQAPDGV